MSTSKKIFLRVLPIVLVLMVVITSNVFANSGLFITTESLNDVNTGSNSLNTVDTAVKKTWNTVALVFQILAVAAIVFAGIRYMFTSADGKADIKKQTIGLVVGAILVFAASGIINFIVSITNEVVAPQ